MRGKVEADKDNRTDDKCQSLQLITCSSNLLSIFLSAADTLSSRTVSILDLGELHREVGMWYNNNAGRVLYIICNFRRRFPLLLFHIRSRLHSAWKDKLERRRRIGEENRRDASLKVPKSKAVTKPILVT